MKTHLILFLLFFSVSASSQELSAERKVYNIKTTQDQLFHLPYEIDYIRNTIIPETQRRRMELAPHYPDLSAIERNQTVIDQAFITWVTDYPAEYSAYYEYLRVTVATR